MFGSLIQAKPSPAGPLTTALPTTTNAESTSDLEFTGRSTGGAAGGGAYVAYPTHYYDKLHFPDFIIIIILKIILYCYHRNNNVSLSPLSAFPQVSPGGLAAAI
jgi:hypothetical protein